MKKGFTPITNASQAIFSPSLTQLHLFTIEPLQEITAWIFPPLTSLFSPGPNNPHNVIVPHQGALSHTSHQRTKTFLLGVNHLKDLYTIWPQFFVTRYKKIHIKLGCFMNKSDLPASLPPVQHICANKWKWHYQALCSSKVWYKSIFLDVLWFHPYIVFLSHQCYMHPLPEPRNAINSFCSSRRLPFYYLTCLQKVWGFIS